MKQVLRLKEYLMMLYLIMINWIAVVVDDFKVQKDELIRICHEIRILRWKKQSSRRNFS